MLSRERATLAPTFPPPATTTYISGLLRCPGGLERAHVAGTQGVGEHRDGGLGGTNGVEPALRVEVGARRVEHAHDDTADPVALLRPLRDDDVRVVAVGGDGDCIRVLDAGLTEDLGVHAMTDDEAAVPVAAEPGQRLLALVDDVHVPALAIELECD